MHERAMWIEKYPAFGQWNITARVFRKKQAGMVTINFQVILFIFKEIAHLQTMTVILM